MKGRDLHVHTPYCGHAEGAMEEYVLSAIERGLFEVGFLAHAEVGIDPPVRSWLEPDALDGYWEEGRALKRKYETQILVTVGLELGLNPKALGKMHQIIVRHPWDRIGLAYHFVHYRGSWLNIGSRSCAPLLKGLDQREITLAYYRGLLSHLTELRPDMICHFDLGRRYMTDFNEDPEVRRLILRILDVIAGLGAALEVNTSGYSRFGGPYPAGWIVMEAVARGVELVLGSDSHRPDQVGRHFDEAFQYVLAALASDREGEVTLLTGR